MGRFSPAGSGGQLEGSGNRPTRGMIAQGCVGNYVILDKIRLIGPPRTFDLTQRRESVDSAVQSVKSRKKKFNAAIRLRP